MRVLELIANIAQIISVLLAGGILLAIYLAREQLKVSQEQLHQGQSQIEKSQEQLAEAIHSREAKYLADKLSLWHSGRMQGIQRVVRNQFTHKGSIDSAWMAGHDKEDFTSIPDFFNDLAALIELGAVHEERVFEFFGPFAVYYWAAYATYVIELRTKAPYLYVGFEELANRSLRDDNRGKPFVAFNRIEVVRQLTPESEECERGREG